MQERKRRGNMDDIKLDSFDFYRPHRFYLIMLMSTTLAIVTPLSRTTKRPIILENFAKRQNQIDSSSRLISCTATFIEEYFEYPDRISLLLPDTLQNVSDLVEPLISELRITNVIYTLDVGLMETYVNASANAVILSESTNALEGNNFSFVDYCERDCNFVIVLTNLFTDKESFLIEAGTLVQRMSLQSIFKLAILASVGDSVLSAGSLPVRIDELYALAEPAFLGRCEQEAITIRWRRLSNETKLSSDARIMNVAMFDKFPYAFLNNNTNYLSFGGIEGSMVEEIARSMKIELNREVIEWTRQTVVERELYLRLHNATSDLVFGGLLWDNNRRTQYTTSYGTVNIAWMVPIEVKVSLSGLITPFSANVWYAIICVLIIGGFVKLLFIRDISFLDIAALVLGVATRHPKEKISSKIQFISWAFFGFFLTQLYLGSLADQLMNASETRIESMEELIKSGLKLGGPQRLASLLQTPDETDTEDKVREKIRENFIIFEQRAYIKQFLDVVEGRNTSLALLVMLNLTDTHRMSHLGRAHIMKKTVGSYPLAFATWQSFPYLSEFNFKIQILVQAGLVEFWSDMTNSHKSYKTNDEEDDNSNLDIEDIAPAFLLLIIGYLGGCCLLIIEVIFYPSKMLL